MFYGARTTRSGASSMEIWLFSIWPGTCVYRYYLGSQVWARANTFRVMLKSTVDEPKNYCCSPQKLLSSSEKLLLQINKIITDEPKKNCHSSEKLLIFIIKVTVTFQKSADIF